MKKKTATRFSVSLPPTLREQLDEMAHEKGYDNRSLAIADMIRAQLVEHRQKSDSGEIAGTITLVYDHHKPHLQSSLTGIRTRLVKPTTMTIRQATMMKYGLRSENRDITVLQHRPPRPSISGRRRRRP